MYDQFDFDEAEITIKSTDGTIISGIADLSCLKITREKFDVTTFGSNFKEYIAGPKTVYFEATLRDVKVDSIEKPTDKTERLLRMIDGEENE